MPAQITFHFCISRSKVSAGKQTASQLIIQVTGYRFLYIPSNRVHESKANYSAGKRDRGKNTPPPPGGEAPREEWRRGAKPPDFIEQEAKPPVQWKAVLQNGFNVS